jgi:hypothetical protein
LNSTDSTGHHENFSDRVADEAGGDLPITPFGRGDSEEGISSDPGGEPMLPPSSGRKAIPYHDGARAPISGIPTNAEEWLGSRYTEEVLAGSFRKRVLVSSE